MRKKVSLGLVAGTIAAAFLGGIVANLLVGSARSAAAQEPAPRYTAPNDTRAQVVTARSVQLVDSSGKVRFTLTVDSSPQSRPTRLVVLDQNGKPVWGIPPEVEFHLLQR
jgi:hypothetical protein